MLYLNLTESSSDRDPKESIEEALHVAQVLQVGVKLVFNNPWFGLTLEVCPADPLHAALWRFDEEVERQRQLYARNHVSMRMPTRADLTRTLTTDLG